MPGNLVRVCRFVEQHRKSAIMLAWLVPGAWLGAQRQAGVSKAAPESTDKVSCALRRGEDG